jgi:hypothetical protein
MISIVNIKNINYQFCEDQFKLVAFEELNPRACRL